MMVRQKRTGWGPRKARKTHGSGGRCALPARAGALPAGAQVFEPPRPPRSPRRPSGLHGPATAASWRSWWSWRLDIVRRPLARTFQDPAPSVLFPCFPWFDLAAERSDAASRGSAQPGSGGGPVASGGGGSGVSRCRQRSAPMLPPKGGSDFSYSMAQSWSSQRLQSGVTPRSAQIRSTRSPIRRGNPSFEGFPVVDNVDTSVEV